MLTNYQRFFPSSRSSSASSAASISLPKHLPSSPQIHPHHSTTPVLPLSIPNLATSHNFSLRPQTHPHHHAMFATPATLPPPPPLTSNSLVVPGHPAGPGYSGRCQFLYSPKYLHCGSTVFVAGKLLSVNILFPFRFPEIFHFEL